MDDLGGRTYFLFSGEHAPHQIDRVSDHRVTVHSVVSELPIAPCAALRVGCVVNGTSCMYGVRRRYEFTCMH